jgi:protein-glutamine gamma-glutamyltransferase
MSAGAVATAIGGRAVDRRVLGPAVVRHRVLPAMALLAAMEWGVLLSPSPRVRLALCVAIALGALAAAIRCETIGPRARVAAVAGIGLAAAVAVLLTAGVPLRLLGPRHWGDLVSSLAQGVQSLPAIGVPYRGLDPWVRIVLIAAGGLLLVLAALLAARALRRGRRPLGAAVVLTATYVIPVVERPPAHPFVWGTLLTLLLGALLWADRLERGHAGPAAVFVVVAIAGALVLAPRLDAADPWLDYRSIVESLGTGPSIGFDWNHGYGPLRWPRDNRVMLRVASDRPRYWKAVDLDTFDGTRWITTGGDAPPGLTELARGHADWRVRLRFTVRDLRSPYYVTAGTGLAVDHSPRLVLPSSPGTFATGRDALRRGDSYAAEVYAPDPSVRELRAAGSHYPPLAAAFLTMDLPPEVGGPVTGLAGAPSTLAPLRLEFPQFSVRTPPTAVDAAGGRYTNGGALLEASQYAPVYRLARRLRAPARSPYEYVRAVQARLATGYAYTESPPRPRPGRPPLVSFLFDSHAGYCQQFSGAMALLLRMGGVPARVSSGFSPGTFDEARHEWVVRDVDAHSWVEVYFPRLGWITFDPTPGIAPPRTQLLNGPAPLGARETPLRPDSRRADVPARGPGGGSPAVAPGSRLSPWIVLLAALLAGGAVAAATRIARGRGAGPAPGELAELERALRRTGRPIEPGVTLQALERRFTGHAPGAAAYVAAVRLARYGGRPVVPRPGERAALRAELAAGLGWSGRLRAWWALPPAWPRP